MSIENIFPNKQQFDTINERLLEIANNVAGGSSKLNKPANPSAESAVTMLADGTVGTKPLSEIGGGGGKLYRHQIYAAFNTEVGGIRINIINTSNTKITENEYFHSYLGYGTVAYFNGMKGSGAVGIYFVSESSNYKVRGAVANTQNTGTGYYLDITDTFQDFTDTVIEL